ncbi:hypothetical protein MVEN_01597000 [Mycena venus]|uniref:BTB domain-containing protein n=1 Tax=Mycena venus TaxID=2733690 RepID=A0A8H6XS60_9AGAR|nr:hypothetical protein MVEN_01597000 [Mycena venus]
MAQVSSEGSSPADLPFSPSSPFDDLTADTIIRSSDGFDFRVHRVVLSQASPFFKDMFSLPQAASQAPEPIVVAESGRLFDRFLRVWYPGAQIVVAFDGLEELGDIIELALSKYDMQFLSPILQNHLRMYRGAHYVGVFALACRYGWGDVARAAAKDSLKLSLTTLFNDTNSTPQLKHVTADRFQALLRYHHACGLAASLAGRLLPWSDAKYSWLKCTNCAAYTLEYDVPGLTRRVTPRAWIFHYLDEASSILKEKPAASVQDHQILLASQVKATACSSFCRYDGLSDFATFVAEKYVPAVNAAIEGVSLDIPF